MRQGVECSDVVSYAEIDNYADTVIQKIAEGCASLEKFSGTETDLANSILDKAIDSTTKEYFEQYPSFSSQLYNDLITLHAENNLKMAALNQLSAASQQYSPSGSNPETLHISLKEYSIFVDPSIRRYVRFFEDTTPKESGELSLFLDRNTYLIHRVIEAFFKRYMSSSYSNNVIAEHILVRCAELSGLPTYPIMENIKLVKNNSSYVFDTGVGTAGSTGSRDELVDGVWVPARYSEELTYESLIRKGNDYYDDEEFAENLIRHLQDKYPNIKAESDFFRYESLHESGQQYRVSFDSLAIINLAKERGLFEDEFIKNLCRDISVYIEEYRENPDR